MKKLLIGDRKGVIIAIEMIKNREIEKNEKEILSPSSGRIGRIVPDV